MDDLDLVLDDVIGVEREFFDRNRVLELVRGAVNAALWNSGKKERGFAEGFTRNGAGVDADASDDFLPLDQAYFLAEFGRLYGGLLAGRSGSYDEKIVVGHMFRG